MVKSGFLGNLFDFNRAGIIMIDLFGNIKSLSEGF